ncbi:MAG TPA: exodeoxyribonuclease VII small subunit [Spirochaetia bacterium]|nr:exodeoxyribonuclease VII small subunit [Spirochaetia bacterium]
MKSFEERLSRLEELSEKIKDVNIPLEEAVALFEEGIKLSKSLEKELAKIERRVEILINQPVGEEDKPEMELFPELAEEDQQ